MTQKFPAANADAVREGEKQRACTLTPGWPLEFTESEKPTFCNRYEPLKEPGLVAIVRRALGVGGYVKYDERAEEFRPMTPEEIAKLREEFPDRPVAFQHGMPTSVDDIINGPQIGILKPGEKLPGQSDEINEVVDGLFGSGGGIFDKKS